MEPPSPLNVPTVPTALQGQKFPLYAPLAGPHAMIVWFVLPWMILVRSVLQAMLVIMFYGCIVSCVTLATYVKSAPRIQCLKMKRLNWGTLARKDTIAPLELRMK